jgi:aryl-alcohol dehydrogenase-like predicted oxidoreductase
MSNNPLQNTRVGFGAMSLCISSDRPTEAVAVRMIEEAIDEGRLNFIDTADAYCLGEEEFGYGERIMEKVAGRNDVLLATKGGYTRKGDNWERCGDPKYLRSACEASLRRLGVSQIDLYQLHGPDPRVPYEDSVGELTLLRSEGKIKYIGVSNTSLKQLQMAKDIANVCSVQNPLAVIYYDKKWEEPLLRFCEDSEIRFIAHSPLSGHANPFLIEKLSEEFNALARDLIMTPYQLALLRLSAYSPMIVPIPGSKSKEHILENLATSTMAISQEIVEQIDNINLRRLARNCR